MRPTDKHYCQRTNPRIIQPKIKLHKKTQTACVSFELRPSGKATLLHFSQEGFVEADDTYALMNTGWAYYLVSLKLYLEKGKGQPSPHVDFSILIL